jgi:hypothetical protein
MKRFCAKCGRELISTVVNIQAGFDTFTGEPIIYQEIHWKCPQFKFSLFRYHDKYRTDSNGRIIYSDPID